MERITTSSSLFYLSYIGGIHITFNKQQTTTTMPAHQLAPGGSSSDGDGGSASVTSADEQHLPYPWPQQHASKNAEIKEELASLKRALLRK